MEKRDGKIWLWSYCKIWVECFFLNPKKWVEKMGWTVKSTEDHGGVEWLSLMVIKNMSNSVQATKSAENCHVCFDMTV